MIIVLDGTFTYGVNASSSQLNQALIKYLSKKDTDGGSKEPRREKKFHKEIGMKFLTKKQLYRHLQPRKAEKMMRRIITRNRVKLEKAEALARLQNLESSKKVVG